MIDIHILAEELGGTVLTSGYGGARRLNLRSARLPSGDGGAPGALSPGYLYVVDGAQVSRLGACEGLSLAVAGPVETTGLPAGADVLLLPDEPGLDDVPGALSRILDVFEGYEALGTRMSTSAALGQSAGTVLSQCADHLSNPVALFDATWMFIAEAGRFEQGKSDAIWDDVHRKGYTTIEHGSRDEMRRLQEGPEPVIMDAAGISTLSTSIHSGGRVVAYLAMTDVNAPFTEGQVSVLAWIKRSFETAWPFFELTPDRSGILNGVALRVIYKMPVGEELVATYLGHRDWGMDDGYRLIHLFRRSGTFPDGEVSFLHHKMEALFPLDVVISVEGGVLVVVRRRASLQDGQAVQKRSELERLVRDEGLQCAVSEEMPSFLDLGRAWSQCEAVRSVLKGRDAGTTASMADVARPYVVDALEGSVPLDDLCSPAVRALSERPNGALLVESLRVYLMHGRNLSHAAQELCVHRNTLMYRVEQIEAQLGLDLAELGEDELFYLYLSCLIVERGDTAR